MNWYPSLQRLAVAIESAAALLGLLALEVRPSVADDAGAKGPPVAENAEPDPWRFSFAAYAWLMSIGGNVTVNNQAIDTNASFIDLLQKSNTLVGLMGYFEAGKGRAGFYTDFVFTSLGFGAGQAVYRNPTPGLKISTSANAALTYRMFIVEPGGVFELARWSDTAGATTAVDATLGFRYWNNSIDATFDAAANVDFSGLGLQRSFGLTVARADAIQWVDPVIGFRLRHQFTPHHEISVRGDIGGFGLGSQLTWQALGTYGYNWQLEGGGAITAFVGFRALGVNYVSPSSGIDATAINEVLYGPFLGARYRF